MTNDMNLKELQKKYNLDELEIYSQNTSNQKVLFTANELKQMETQDSNGIALRLLNNKKIGFTASFGKYNIDEMLKQALEISKFSPEIEVSFPSLKKIENSKEQADINMLSKFKEKGESIIKTILKEAPGVLVDVSFDSNITKEEVNNSKGLNYIHSSNLYSFSINLRETLENDFIDIFTASVDSSIPDHTEYTKEILSHYKLLKNHAKIKNGSYPLLFTSKAAKDLLNIIELALNGNQVNEKSSPWHNKLGKKVLSNLITLKQDPKIGYMARSLDDEGNEVKELTLVNNGVLENFYFDMVSASRRGPGTERLSLGTQPSTGNGFKDSLESQPSPSLLNLIVSNGKRSLDEIIKDIKYGVLVDQTMGGLSTNISGDFSVNVDVGFLIENGKLIGRVKDTMISGNIYNALNNVIELSNNPQWHWSNTYNPDMLVGGFTVTAQ